MAWAALGVSVAGLLVAAVLAPAPSEAPVRVDLTLPGAPDPYAPSARGGAAEPGPEPSPEPGAAPAPLPRIVVAEAPGEVEPEGGGEVVITMGRTAPPPSAPAIPKAVPPAAPDPALTAETPSGIRPAIGRDGRTPFSAYRRLEPVGEARGVAVVVSGLGLDPGLTERAIALPGAVSLAFAPYARNLPAQFEAARAAGHEVLVELPMGTPGVDPGALGPASLLADRTPAANAKRLEWLLTRAPAYPMVTNYLGRGFSGDDAAMGPVMRAVSRLGVAYIDDTGAAASAARFAGVPYAATDALLDPGADDVGARLSAMAARARAGEVALAKVYATPESLDALADWAARMPKGTALVPASTAVRAP